MRELSLITEALHLAEIVLSSEVNHSEALTVKLKALELLRSRCRNSNERDWLDWITLSTKPNGNLGRRNKWKR